MAQFVYTMNRVGKIVPPKRQILKDISLSFFPGAKIGVLGLNGAGKSTLLKIMAGVDTEIEGEAIPMPGIKIGYLPQEPVLDPEKTVRETVAEGLGDIFDAQEKLNKVYEAYADPDADFDALAAEQARLEAIIATGGTNADTQMEIAADALRLPPWDAKIGNLSREHLVTVLHFIQGSRKLQRFHFFTGHPLFTDFLQLFSLFFLEPFQTRFLIRQILFNR